MLVILCAPSCNDEQEVKQREALAILETKKQIREEFESDYLSEAALYAYETKAKQKLSDFFDYLKIVTDTSLDQTLRIKAGEMIKSNFLTKNIAIQLGPGGLGEEKEIELSLFIKNGLENEVVLPPFTIDSVQVHELLHRTGNMTYAGKLIFAQHFINHTDPSTLINNENRTTDFYLMKETKTFGPDTLKVWNVRLGDIK